MRLSRDGRPAAGVSCPCRGASYFLSRGREKVTKERATPRTRPPGILPCGCACGLRGFPTAHPCTGGKLARFHAGHPADFPSPTRRVRGAPGNAARSCAHFLKSHGKGKSPPPRPSPAGRGGRRQARGASVFAVAVVAPAVAVASGAHDARLLFRGPSEAVRRGRSGRAASESMDGLAFPRGHDARSKSPATPHALSVHGRTESWASRSPWPRWATSARHLRCSTGWR